jgi:hypothetical protein
MSYILYGENNRPEWITIEPLLPNETKEAESLFLSGLLGFGEAEAIILAKRLKPEWFLTDDTELPALIQGGHSELSNLAGQYYQTRPLILILTKQGRLL